jgi:DNA invertase Pin-like site-specific DNA recombinase
MSSKERTKAVAYFRTSSSTNVGVDKDSEKRQRAAVTQFAKANGYDLVDSYYDAAVSGADPIDERKGFAAMLERIAGNGVSVIIVETASRFARDLIVQETGWRFLQGLGVTLVAADSPDSFLDTTPTAVLIRQVLGAVSQFEKAALVAKLKSARDRKKCETGKCGGRKSYAERDAAMVGLAKKLARYPVNGHKRSLREIAVELQAQGYVNERGALFNPKSISSMLGRLS